MVSIGSVFHSVSNTVSQGVSTVAHGVEDGVKKFGPTVLKTGIVVTAATAGTALGGPMGGAIAGGLASAAVSAGDQEIQNGHVDWGMVAINGAAGAIPGGVMGKLGGKLLSGAGDTFESGALKTAAQSISEKTIPKYVANGVAGGAVIGGGYGAATSSYQQLKSGNPFSITRAAENAGVGAVTGAVTGGLLNRALGKNAVSTQARKTDILTDKLTSKAASAAEEGSAGTVAQTVARNGQSLKAADAPSLRANIGLHSLGAVVKGPELEWLKRHHFVA